MQMTEREICQAYRTSKDRGEQIMILAELNCVDRAQIMRILLSNGEEVRYPVPGRGKKRKAELTESEYVKALFKRIEYLNSQINKYETEYREILVVLEGKGCIKTANLNGKP